MGQAGGLAYREGAVTLKDFVGRTRDPDWGTLRYARSLRQIVGPEEARKWVQKASQKTKAVFDLRRTSIDEIGRSVDISAGFSSRHPEAAFEQREVILRPKVKTHIVLDHPGDVEWMHDHQELIRRAVTAPMIVDAEPRRLTGGRYTVAHITNAAGSGDPFLVVVLRYARFGSSDSHEIYTMYRAPRRYVFDASDRMKPRWRRLKKQ